MTAHALVPYQGVLTQGTHIQRGSTDTVVCVKLLLSVPQTVDVWNAIHYE